MPPILALVLWSILLCGLFYFDPAKDSASSSAIWIPLIWMFIIATRLPSQWIGGGYAGQALQAYEEGNPLDRAIFLLLIVLAIIVLTSRSFRWGNFVACNPTLVAFLAFAMLSALWSDLPFVTFKKWFRDLGNYFVLLVALSDSQQGEAIRMLLRRLSFLLVPLSIVLIKYYPEIGRQYSQWSGAASYSGAATTKDELGAICLVSGIFFFWDILIRWSNRREQRTKRIIAVNIALLTMTLWLLNLADSATCRICMLFGCLVMLAARSAIAKRHPLPLKIVVPLVVCICLFLIFGVDMKASIAGAVGRDPTLTDRTLLWSYLLNMKINPIVGTGYASFWLGPRLAELWTQFAFRPNQAHDGYIEIYLNLGLIGALLLFLFIIASYRTVCRRMKSNNDLGSFSIAIWAVLPLYNITTAAFAGGELVWLVFLLVAIAVTNPDQNAMQKASLDKRERAACAPREPPLVGQAIGSGKPR